MPCVGQVTIKREDEAWMDAVRNVQVRLVVAGLVQCRIGLPDSRPITHNQARRADGGIEGQAPALHSEAARASRPFDGEGEDVELGKKPGSR